MCRAPQLCARMAAKCLTGAYAFGGLVHLRLWAACVVCARHFSWVFGSFRSIRCSGEVLLLSVTVLKNT